MVRKMSKFRRVCEWVAFIGLSVGILLMILLSV